MIPLGSSRGDKPLPLSGSTAAEQPSTRGRSDRACCDSNKADSAERHVCCPPFRKCQEIGCLPGTVRAAVRLLAYFSDHGGGQMEPLPDCDSCPQCAAWELVESLSKALPR